MSDATDARDKAIKRVGGRDPGWMLRALEAVRSCARDMDNFTTDDVLTYLADEDKPKKVNGCWEPVDPRALGAVMVASNHCGVCNPTGVIVRSSRAVSHARRKLSWRSCLR